MGEVYFKPKGMGLWPFTTKGVGLVLFRLQGMELWPIKAKGIGSSESPSPIPFGLKETFSIPFGIMPARPYTICFKKSRATVKHDVFAKFLAASP